ncbi:hypothetical protein FRC16_002549 [Serendipita sp. 398]|nr:hypothetical protein FRC16_002549 [Serendipita sp. 398]
MASVYLPIDRPKSVDTRMKSTQSDELIAILTSMILYKSVWLKAKSEYARGIMNLLARDGAIVYLGVLSATITIVAGSMTPSIRIQLTVANLLLPLYSISTSRILLNLRLHLSGLGFSHVRGNAVISGLELTSLYLGGHYGGIAPARGIEGATVKEIGNTTIIDVPVEDYGTERSVRYLQRSISLKGYEVEGPPSVTLNEPQPSLPPPPLPKMSTLGATPRWEHWDDLVPTKDCRLSVFKSFSPPDSDTLRPTTADSEDLYGRESSSSPSVDGASVQKRDILPKRASRDTVIHWAEPCCTSVEDEGRPGSSASSPRQSRRHVEGLISLGRQLSLPARPGAGGGLGGTRSRAARSQTLSRSRSIPRPQYPTNDPP